MEPIHILSGVRTPFASFGGALKDMHPTDLGVVVSTEAMLRAGLQAGDIEEVFFGNVLPCDSQSIYLARHIALRAGVPVQSPALTVNRLCGSGLEAVLQAALAIATGRCSLALAGGTESMSNAPYVAKGARFGNRLGSAVLEDVLLEGLTDRFVDCAMGKTAENLAKKFNISRSAQDDFAARSQNRAAAARDSGRFASEIVPMELKDRKGVVRFESDEYIRADGVARLPDLKPAFDKAGTVTAGNASGINDGAGALVIASDATVKKRGLESFARITGWGLSGCVPEHMGLGPVFAIPKALAMAGHALGDMDLIEVNEAFAAQVLAVVRELGIEVEKLNVNGGAIALGHPLGASGARVLLTLCHELKARGGGRGVASLCIGGGQGIAMNVEV